MTHPPGEASRSEQRTLVERISMPDSSSMSEEQRRSADALIRGPRKGVVGPYIALLHTPRLLNLMEPLGTELRFHGRLDDRIRELVILAVARHTCNQFEWTTHVPLALGAGVSRDTVSAVLEGRAPTGTPEDEMLALDCAKHLMDSHGIPDDIYREANSTFGDEGIIELVTLIGYFVTICWIMNVARTQSPGNPEFGIVPLYG